MLLHIFANRSLSYKVLLEGNLKLNEKAASLSHCGA